MTPDTLMIMKGALVVAEGGKSAGVGQATSVDAGVVSDDAMSFEDQFLSSLNGNKTAHDEKSGSSGDAHVATDKTAGSVEADPNSNGELVTLATDGVVPVTTDSTVDNDHSVVGYLSPATGDIVLVDAEKVKADTLATGLVITSVEVKEVQDIADSMEIDTLEIVKSKNSDEDIPSTELTTRSLAYREGAFPVNHSEGVSSVEASEGVSSVNHREGVAVKDLSGTTPVLHGQLKTESLTSSSVNGTQVVTMGEGTPRAKLIRSADKGVNQRPKETTHNDVKPNHGTLQMKPEADEITILSGLPEEATAESVKIIPDERVLPGVQAKATSESKLPEQLTVKTSQKNIFIESTPETTEEVVDEVEDPNTIVASVDETEKLDDSADQSSNSESIKEGSGVATFTQVSHGEDAMETDREVRPEARSLASAHKEDQDFKGKNSSTASAMTKNSEGMTGLLKGIDGKDPLDERRTTVSLSKHDAEEVTEAQYLDTYAEEGGEEDGEFPEGLMDENANELEANILNSSSSIDLDFSMDEAFKGVSGKTANPITAVISDEVHISAQAGDKVGAKTLVPTTQAASTPHSSYVSKPFDTVFVKGVAARVSVLFNDNIGKATITLNPPELGRLKVEISLKDNSIQASFRAENMNVKDALERNMDLLKSALIEQGISVDKLHVALDDHYRDGSTRFGHETPQRQSSDNRKGESEVNTAADSATNDSHYHSGNNSGVDVFI